ncbi:NAD(P)-dependent alcohol dehydrogenase [Ancrocorticia populi]|uniref:NAD(P)-dependent alcohol dehydrogenase n=1 Tax=Ancrocorticia populi TaxID=2175228 RepID=UPI0023538EFB|nr:NAD(P)-dependent alcohol dehydrogenase [Ancrocorticia populi]
MKAVQYREIGGRPEVVEIDDPTPGPGQVLLKMTAAGLCHSDIAVMSWTKEQYRGELPLTLGHECVGTIIDASAGSRELVTMGEKVLVYGPWGCGRCRQCAQGYENYCYNAGKFGIFPPGLGRAGGLAEYMLVDRARYLVPIGDLDPITAAPLTDAGLTPYHAVMHSLPKLKAHSTAVVFGVGGLGHVAIQLLKHLTPSTVIALDVSEKNLELARKVGADYVFKSDQDAVKSVKDLTEGLGAEVVFDFVGIQATADLGAQMTRVRGDWNLVGIGGGVAKVGFGLLPYECQVFSPYWGTRADLYDVVDLARKGIINIHTEKYALDDAPEAYRRLEAGAIVGRAVIDPTLKESVLE